jgi:hypothetical protein
MRLRIAAWVLMVSVGIASQVCGQTPGENQGKPMNGSPAPDTSRMQQEMAEAKAAPAAGPLKLTYGDKSAEWTAATLAPLEHQTLTLYNEHAKANQTYSGVALIDLLARLGVPDKPRGKEFRLYLVAEGSDGYQVVYSIGEVTPDVHDGSVIVADSLDGKPIGNDGPLKLVATGEKRPARWVRNLVAVRVLTAQ